MIRTRFCAILLAALVITPGIASAQCGTGGGMTMSGSDHQVKGASEKSTKHDKAINKILSDRAARMRLFELIAEDDVFLQEFFGFSFESPHRRTLGAAILKQAQSGAAVDDRSGLPPQASSPPDAIFQCPMHPEVASATAGTCPKCGMTLEKVKDPSTP